MGSTNARPDTDPSPGTCDGHSLVFHQHRARALFKDAYALERWSTGPKRADIRKAQAHARCIRVAKVRRQLHHLRSELAAQLHDYAHEQRQAAKLTPYPGPNGTRWAIPWYVVDCESHGDWGAYNPSSHATGPYQMLPSTYGGVCEVCDWSHNDQHLAAGRVWARSGGGEWQCA